MERQTFSEFWYRVADLKPRLIPAVIVRKQVFRRESWYIVQSPINNEFFRLHAAGYAFIGLLDGRRTVADAWKIVCDRHGDDAPTQGEAIQLIGQLYQSNLLQADLPPDADGLFQRYKKKTEEARNPERGHEFSFSEVPVMGPRPFPHPLVGAGGLAVHVEGRGAVARRHRLRIACHHRALGGFVQPIVGRALARQSPVPLFDLCFR